MKKDTHTKGYSLVEVLVSIAVLLIAIIGPMTIASQGIKSSAFALEQNTAFFLAQEGMEAIFSIRGNQALIEKQSETDNAPAAGSESSWDWVDNLQTSGSPWNGPCADFNGDDDVCEFGIDYSDDTLRNNFSSGECDAGNEDRCLLYENTSNDRSYYSHTGTNESPYTRIITLTRRANKIVEVNVVVTWKSRVFGDTLQSVEMASELQDITEDL